MQGDGKKIMTLFPLNDEEKQMLVQQWRASHVDPQLQQCQVELQATKELLADYQRWYFLSTKNQENTQKQLQETQEALQNTQKKLEAAEKSLSDMRNEMAQIKEELSESNLQCEIFEERCSRLQEERDKLKEECSKLQDKPETSETAQTPTESLPQKEKKKPKSHADELGITMFILMILIALAESLYMIGCQVQGMTFWDLWLIPMGGLTILGMCFFLGIGSGVFFSLSDNMGNILHTIVWAIIWTAACGAFILLTNGITAGILALIH